MSPVKVLTIPEAGQLKSMVMAVIMLVVCFFHFTLFLFDEARPPAGFFIVKP